jgi:peptidoglycan/xylan/chitin deacetylase (PgdA/CDA1 family)
MKAQKVPILLYHRILDKNDYKFDEFTVSKKAFEWQMKYLSDNGYQTISLEQLVLNTKKSDLPPRPVIITFDDGHKDNFEIAFPILKKHNFKPTIFLVLEFVKDPDNKANGSCNQYLSLKEIMEMQTFGAFFESHGVSHRSLQRIEEEAVRSEVADSKKYLEKVLAKQIKFFAYPYSQYSTAVKSIVAEAGYLGACGGLPNFNGVISDNYEIGRTEIFDSDSKLQFMFKVRTGYCMSLYVIKILGKMLKDLKKWL